MERQGNKRNYLILCLSFIFTAVGISIFLLYSQSYLVFSPPWPIRLWNFFGSLGEILLYLAGATLFIWFFHGKRMRLYQHTNGLFIWAILVSIAVYYLENFVIRSIGIIPFANQNMANSINVAIGVLQSAGFALIGLYFLKRIDRQFIALVVSWLTIFLWAFFLLDPITYWIDTLFGSQGYLYYWQFEHPEWFLSYWPQIIGTGILVAAAWFVHQTSQGNQKNHPVEGR